MFKICIRNEEKLWICIYLQIIFPEIRQRQFHALNAVEGSEEDMFEKRLSSKKIIKFETYQVHKIYVQWILICQILNKSKPSRKIFKLLNFHPYCWTTHALLITQKNLASYRIHNFYDKTFSLFSGKKAIFFVTDKIISTF